MKQSTYDLAGHALDWAVAKCEGHDAELNYDEVVSFKLVMGNEYRLVWKPSTNWAQGGAIVERERISIEYKTGTGWWVATRIEGSSVSEEYGRTPLVAAMRCYVASKLGNEVEIPAELTQGETQ